MRGKRSERAGQSYRNDRSAADKLRRTEQANYVKIAERLAERKNVFAQSVLDQVRSGRPISPAQARTLRTIESEHRG